MIIETVTDVYNLFGFNPNEVVYYDRTENILDSLYINGTDKSYEDIAEWFGKYGDYAVDELSVEKKGSDIVVHIDMHKEEGEGYES